VSNPDESTDWPEPYTGWDFLQDSLRQVHELEAATRERHEEFMANDKRLAEWEIDNIGARRADAKPTPWRDVPQACDEESMTIWFEYEGEFQCKAP
jgi:hypothetical protein